MKKLFVVMLLIVACLSVTACSKEETAEEKAVQAVKTKQEKEHQWYMEHRVEPPDTSNFEV